MSKFKRLSIYALFVPIEIYLKYYHYKLGNIIYKCCEILKMIIFHVIGIDEMSIIINYWG